LKGRTNADILYKIIFNKNVQYGLTFGLIFFLIIFVIVTYVSKEPQLLYYWDFAGYYREFIKYSNDFDLHKIIDAVNISDYNPTSILIPSLIGKMFSSTSRLTYILSVAVLYLFPFVILFTHVTKLFFRYKKYSYFLVLTFLIATASCFLQPVLRGYPDICGLLFVLLSILVCYKQNLLKLNIKVAVLLGICLYMPFLLRRWYAYTIVALCMTLPFFNTCLNLDEIKQVTRYQIKNLIINFSITAVTILLLLYVFQKELVFNILNTDYSVIYSGYQTTFLISLLRLIDSIGLWLLPLFIFGLFKAFSQINSKPSASILVLFSLINLVISFVMFTKTQSPGMQHMLPFCLWIYIVASFGIIELLRLLSNYSYLRTGFIVTLLSIFCFLNYTCFFELYSVGGDSFLYKKHILPSKSYSLHVDNYSEYVRLDKVLKQLDESHKEKIYILSSNGVLNHDMQFLKTGLLSKKVFITHDVDLRDGFPVQFLLAKYVVITNPLQIHLPNWAQRVISIPRDCILNKRNIGKAYVETEYKFTLHNKVEAHIYRKNRACSMEEVEEFLNLFYKHYPEWKSMHEKKILLKSILSSDILLDDERYSAFDYNLNQDAIYAHPGTQPVSVIWNLGKINKLILKSTNATCKDADPISVGLTTGKETSTYVVEKGQQITIDTSLFKNRTSTLIIDKMKNNHCDSLLIKAE
jgi:hypothetical protein